jgi:phosphatidylinositol alpha-1,6-mannosyltransferase
MNIIVVSYIYPRKNNARRGIFVHQRAKYLAREGHNISVVTTRDSEDKKQEAAEGVSVYRVSRRDIMPQISGFFFTFMTLFQISKLIKQKKTDFVVQEFVGASNIVLGIFLKIKKIKFAVISHGSKWEIQTGPIRKLLARLALSFPEKVICVSRNVKDRLTDIADRKKLFVVNNGMDTEYLRPSMSTSDFRRSLGIGKKQVLLTISNLVSKKGIDVIIRAFANISKKNRNLVYIIVGEGPEKQKLQSLIKELRLGSKVILEDKKVGSDLANYYSICDLFIVMSRDIDNEIESFGIVYIEASYFKKPIIGGISGGTADAVIDGKTGFLIDSNDQEQLEEKIIQLLMDKKLREKLGKAGKERVIKGFLWSHSAKKLLEILKK